MGRQLLGFRVNQAFQSVPEEKGGQIIQTHSSQVELKLCGVCEPVTSWCWAPESSFIYTKGKCNTSIIHLNLELFINKPSLPLQGCFFSNQNILGSKSVYTLNQALFGPAWGMWGNLHNSAMSAREKLAFWLTQLNEAVSFYTLWFMFIEIFIKLAVCPA